MLKRVSQVLISLLGFGLGGLLVFTIEKLGLVSIPSGVLGGVIYIGIGLIFAIITYLLSPRILRALINLTKKIEDELETVPAQDIILGAAGLIIGLIIAFFISQPINNIPVIGSFLSIAVYLILGYLGIRVVLRKKPDLEEGVSSLKLMAKSKQVEELIEDTSNVREEIKAIKSSNRADYKVLDTSVIIDGRIVGIVEAGFIEGTIVIPNFVLKELQHIADSSNDLRRERGRRGLDVLKEIQDQDQVEVIISKDSYDEIDEVDSKLIALASDLDAKLLTNDYNLNKVADLSGVKVLNINELANAVKAPVIHGQTIQVYIVKEGSEEGQGVAYLDDGTMIVIEGGKDYIGENIDVTVTSVIQTSAGKMIFAKIDQ